MAARPQASQAVIQTYKCFLCGYYLSVPPIFYAGTDNEQYRCGRCAEVKCAGSKRVRLYEEVAQHQSFPCSYKDCKKIIPWGRVHEHEKNCPHRTMKCPVYYHNCHEVVLMEDLKQHFQEKHQKNIKDIGAVWEVSSECDYVFLISEDEEDFLVYILHLDEIYSVAVLALNNNKYTKFNLKVIAPQGRNVTLCFDDFSVVRYDERCHCYMCFRKKCSEPHHPYSTKNVLGGMKVDSFTGKLKEDLVRTLRSPSGMLRYSIALVADETYLLPREPSEEDEAEERDEEEDGAYLLKDVPPQFNVEALKKALTCPYCMTYMAPPIFTCVTGHTVCNVCRPRLDKCPTCADPFSYSRNYSLEDMTREVGVPCQNDFKGCNFIGSAAKMYIHEEECSFSKLLRE